MFDIERVILTNFKSFRGTHTFTLPNNPGLYLITGRNEDEPRLAGNGAGKSTLLDAIVWCLYGQTSRGLRAADVISWGEKTATVELHLVIGKERVVVIRSQHPNSLTIDGKAVEQQAIVDKVRLGSDAFSYSVVFPQKHTFFFELKASEKLTVFSQIMELEYWLERSKQAQTDSDSIEKRMFVLTGRIGSHQQGISTLQTEIEGLKVTVKEHKAKRKEELTELERRKAQLAKEMAQKMAKLERLHESVESTTNEVEEYRNGLRKQQACLNEQQKKQNEIRQKIALISQASQMKKAQWIKLSELGAECPTCNQKISKAHVRSAKGPLEGEIAKLANERAALEKQNGAATDFLKNIEGNIAKKETIILNVEEDNKRLVGKVSKLEGEIALDKNTINYLQIEIESMAEMSPYEGILKSKEQTLTKLKEKLVEDEKSLNDLSARHKATSYWIQGFKKVRLFVIEETLNDLELEVNNSLTTLGLTDWEIAFDVERENKSGGVTKGFVVLIRNASHPEPVRFEAWSGGEAQRLQLAGDFGLANLIMTQAGLVNKVEFFDEPSSYLSPQGLIDLAETLRERALNEGKKIFWIDHHSLDFGDFEGTYTVVKDEQGSRLYE